MKVSLAILIGLLSCSTLAQQLDGDTRLDCAADLQKLTPCLNNNDEFGQVCCTAVHTLLDKGCFCGWGRPEDNPLWLMQLVWGVKQVQQRCGGAPVFCKEQALGWPWGLPDSYVDIHEAHDNAVLSSSSTGWWVGADAQQMPEVPILASELDTAHVWLQGGRQVAQQADEAMWQEDLLQEANWYTSDVTVEMVSHDGRQGIWSGVSGLLSELYDAVAGVDHKERRMTSFEFSEAMDRMDETDDLNMLVHSLAEVADAISHAWPGEDDVSVTVEVVMEEEEQLADYWLWTLCYWVALAGGVMFVVSLLSTVLRSARRCTRRAVQRCSIAVQPTSSGAQQDCQELTKPLLQNSH